MIFKVATLLLLCAGVNAIPLLNTTLPVVLPEYTALGFYYQINNGPGLNQANNGFLSKLFLGLPYAKPPVGNLRFEKPQPLPHSPLKIVRANAWPKACWQVVDATSMGIHSDEDCLFLNVMRPAAPNLQPLPVLVFIHGGGYEYGYTEEYGYKYFVDNFVTQGLIVVTLQYRLAHFGFMATEDGVINGNYGHFDQVEALKFVKRNIHRFGGDPNKITLAGHSAGSVSVHSLSLSPYTVGLYNQEIHIAGSNYAQWPIDNKIVYSHSKNISDAVGCTQANTHARKNCLKNKPIQAFFDARIALNLTDFPYDVIDILYWTSVYDQDFFAGKTLEQLQQAAPKRRTLYGYDAAEGLLWSFYSNNPITNVFAVGRGFKSNERQNCDLQFIRDFLEQILYDSRFTPAIKDQVKADILEWYQIAPEYATNDLYYFDKLTELYSDLIMKVPTGKEINAKIGYGWDHQYLFAFNYTRPQDRAEIGDLPGHGYFLMYFAGLEIYTNNGINQTAVDTQLQHDLAEMFITFVKTGKPSANGVDAPKITSPDHIAYLEFNPNVVVEDVDLKARTAFWDQLAVKYGWDFVRGVPL